MEPKPGHLGLKYAEQFQDISVAAVYHYRPPYATEALRALLDLVVDEPRVVLDVGCATGDLARPLASQVERVDAVDFSSAMLDRGKTLPGGADPRLNWIYGKIEEVELHPPYALITAGESLHWMAWDIVLPLFQRILTPHGKLAIAGRITEHNPWDSELQVLIDRFSTNREYRHYNIIDELTRRHLFQVQGSVNTPSQPFTQSGEAYIHSIHSRNGFSRERMGEDAASAFDEEVRKLLSPYLQDDQLNLSINSYVVWGMPLGL